MSQSETRREFLYLAAGGFGAVGAGAVVWPLVNSMNPAADTLAVSSIEVSIGTIQPGQAVTAMWRGQPVFIRRRTPEEIELAHGIDAKVDTLRDKQTDAERTTKPEWIIVVGTCTHLGCVPQGQKSTEVRGEYGGWFCPCHGSHYDTSGRIRKGPAPKNLEVPTYKFMTDSKILIG